MTCAIALFVYSRPFHTAKTLDGLRGSSGSAKLPLYVFADGPRSQSDAPDVDSVRKLFDGFDWPAGVTKNFASRNLGLAESIIQGVTQVLQEYDAVIVLEDDIVLASSAIVYFLGGLHHYASVPSVASISGFSHPTSRLRIPKDYPYDSYFLTRNSSWGWATWSDRWSAVSWDLSCWQNYRNDSYLITNMKEVSPDLPTMIDYQHDGGIDSWAVRFTLHHFLNGLVSLTPVYSYVENIGMDGSGTHTRKTRRYKNDLRRASTSHQFPPAVLMDRRIIRRFSKLYRRPSLISRALQRILGRLYC